MQFIDKLVTPGEHPLLLQGLVGQLESILTVPDEIHTPFVAFLGHPHSLQGGTMQNKVVTTLARAFKELGIPSLRYNFRGVGLSAGHYDNGIGESEDMLTLLKSWQQNQPEVQPIFAGFSFGSYVAYRSASQSHSALLITIAPPIHHYDYQQFKPQPNPWIIFQGDADEVVPFSLVNEFTKQTLPAIPLIPFAHTSHFFHGKLLELKAQIQKITRTLI